MPLIGYAFNTTRMDPVLQTFADLSRILYSAPLSEAEAYAMLRDSLSLGQLRSKLEALRLVQNTKLKFDSALFLAHWHGLFPRMLKNFDLIKRADGFELDAKWVNFSNLFNAGWSWKSTQQDARTAEQEKYDLVVNTSCEHMDNSWTKKILADTYVLAQTTNYAHESHVNTCSDLQEFKNKLNFSNIIEATETDCEIYTRYTVLAKL